MLKLVIGQYFGPPGGLFLFEVCPPAPHVPGLGDNVVAGEAVLAEHSARPRLVRGAVTYLITKIKSLNANRC